MQVTIDITDSTGAAVTEFVPGEDFTITVPAFLPDAGIPVNMWIHASAGTMAGRNDITHTTAMACPEAAFSQNPLDLHEFVWTAPAAGAPVTFSVAQAATPNDFYHTATVLFLFSFVPFLCVQYCNVLLQQTRLMFYLDSSSWV